MFNDKYNEKEYIKVYFEAKIPASKMKAIIVETYKMKVEERVLKLLKENNVEFFDLQWQGYIGLRQKFYESLRFYIKRNEQSVCILEDLKELLKGMNYFFVLSVDKDTIKSKASEMNDINNLNALNKLFSMACNEDNNIESPYHTNISIVRDDK